MNDRFSIRLAISGDADAIASLSRTEIEYELPWSWAPPPVYHANTAITNVPQCWERTKAWKTECGYRD